MFLYEKKTNSYQTDTLCIRFSSINNVCLKDELLFYDIEEDIYYFPIDKSYENKKFSYYLLNNNFPTNHFINNSVLNKKYYKINFVDTFKYQVFNNNLEIKNINLKFTNIPIVHISLNNNIGNQYQNAVFSIIGPYYSLERDWYAKEITIRKKGNTSRAFDKHAYRMEFKETDEPLKTINNSPLKENKDWSFDALYTDPSKIRNKLATDIWNLINGNEYNLSSLNVIYLNLYINNKYQGLYTLKNVINRKKLHLDKLNANNTGILLKAIGYGSIDWHNDDFNSIKSKRFQQLEMQYPNNSMYYNKYWPLIMDKLAIYYKSSSNNLDDISKTFDVNNFLDYTIYIELIAGLDNSRINNKYFSMKNINSKIITTPWDMDLTFGLYTGKSSLLSVKKYDLVNEPTNSNSYIGDQSYIKALKERYNYFRKNSLNKEVVIKLIDSYVEYIYYSL